MDLDRRLILGGMGVAAGAAALAAGARSARAQAPAGAVTALLVPGDGDQSAALQQAIDEAAGRAVAVIVPSGSFVVGGIALRSGSVLVGTGRSILRAAGETLLSAAEAHGVVIEGLGLDGGVARFAGCNGLAIRNCDISGKGGGVRIEGGNGHALTANRFAGTAGAALDVSGGSEGALIAQNLVEDVGAGLVARGFAEGTRLAVIQGNLVRGVGAGKGASDRHGCGIAVEADAAITGNVVEGAMLCGILAGMGGAKRDVTITGNLVRQSATGIGLSGDPQGGLIFVSQNMITGAKNGAIRAMDALEPIGPDLTRASAEAYPNLAILQNVATH